MLVSLFASGEIWQRLKAVSRELKWAPLIQRKEAKKIQVPLLKEEARRDMSHPLSALFTIQWAVEMGRVHIK